MLRKRKRLIKQGKKRIGWHLEYVLTPFFFDSYEQKKSDLDALFGDVPLDKLKGEITVLLK